MSIFSFKFKSTNQLQKNIQHLIEILWDYQTSYKWYFDWKKCEKKKHTEILGSPFEESKMFLAARSRWTILCLWRWNIPEAIPRTNSILRSSLNFTSEFNNNLSKLPKLIHISKLFVFHSLQHNDSIIFQKHISLISSFQTITITKWRKWEMIPPSQYSKTMIGWGPFNETPNIWTTFGCGGSSLQTHKQTQTQTQKQTQTQYSYQFNSICLCICILSQVWKKKKER